MSQPKIELIPLRPAVRSDAPVTLDVLLKITPPESERRLQRPVLNLGLVLDRSGSMAADNKLDFARQAAIFAIRQLLPSDRVSLTIFDNNVETLVPNVVAEDKGRIVELIQGIEAGGSTALFAGWKDGSEQVKGNLLADGLNRVILLSDGLANVGESNADVIATAVHRLTSDGVSTTTLGLGDDYNEELLEAIADAGDGNYEYIESPSQLPGIFEKELKELTSLFGIGVSLGIEPREGVTVADVLNDLNKLPNGHLKLSNLVAGCPTNVVVRLNVLPKAKAGELCRFQLTWKAPKVNGQQTAWAGLSLPAINEIIRNEVVAAAQKEAARRPFNLSGRGHEKRVTLDSSLAGILRSADIPHEYISGFGANNHYPRRVFARAARALKRKLGWSPICFSDLENKAYRADTPPTIVQSRHLIKRFEHYLILTLPDESTAVLDTHTLRFYSFPVRPASWEDAIRERITPDVDSAVKVLPSNINLELLAKCMEKPHLQFGECFSRCGTELRYSIRYTDSFDERVLTSTLTGLYRFNVSYPDGGATFCWQFLDGGIIKGCAGRGVTWTVLAGAKAVRATCLFFGIKQPNRIKGESVQEPLAELLERMPTEAQGNQNTRSAFYAVPKKE